MINELEIITMSARTDNRGSAFAMPQAAIDFLDGIIAETHLAQIKPGCIRGNHWHNNRWEVIIAHSQDKWTFAWAENTESEIQSREIPAGDAVAILIPPYFVHGLKNSGNSDIWLTAISNGKYDGRTPDTFAVDLFDEQD